MAPASAAAPANASRRRGRRSRVAARLRRLTRHDWLALAATAAGTSTFAVLSVMQFAQPTAVHAALAAAGVLLTAAGAAASLISGNAERDAKERHQRRILAQSLIEDAFAGAIGAMSGCPDQTGGVLYLPDPSDATLLRPAFTHNKHADIERHLIWRALKGCTGHAWGRQRQTWADLSRTTSSELEERWKLSPMAIMLTRDLQTIVSTPVWSPTTPRRLVGVVSVDCTAPDAQCHLLSEASRAEAVQLASIMAQILELAGLDLADSV
jgi:hypothetical protein